MFTSEYRCDDCGQQAASIDGQVKDGEEGAPLFFLWDTWDPSWNCTGFKVSSGTFWHSFIAILNWFLLLALNNEIKMAEIEVNNYQSVSCDKTEILLEVLTDMLLIAKVPRVHVYVQNTERD